MQRAARMICDQHGGKVPEAVTLLSADLPPRLRSSVLAVRWLGDRAIALARSGEAAAAETNLDRAERLARARHPELLDEVMLWRANLAFTAKRPNEVAEKFARDGLRFARRYHHNEADLLGRDIQFARPNEHAARAEYGQRFADAVLREHV